MSAKINQNFLKLNESYLFSEIARRIRVWQSENPEVADKLIRMGIGDVTRPLPKTVVEAMVSAAREMGEAETFRGYGPEQGYDFLKDAVQKYYTRFGVELKSDEIFISDGAKSDLGNILDLFDKDNTVLVTDPVYPVYVDTNMMDSRKIVYAEAGEENDFLPMPAPEYAADIIYLCSPNNPTGAVYDRAALTKWVEFAKEQGSIILFDSAYECFVTGDYPHSIYEIPGAREVAIEFCSLSKKAGFTGTRCGYTIVPDTLERCGGNLNKMWLRRQTTKFNGVSYITQKGAEAVFSQDGEEEIEENIRYYRDNAKIITDTMDKLNIYYTGGKNSPYIWLKCPGEMDSWEFFDRLLKEVYVVGTPGAGFGKSGERFFRLTAFSTHENTREAMERFEVFVEKLR
ncbi:LL-diaminopimelate aminotransferase [Oribacterium sp. WCC10]|uniref:LL-diaminopimelate aminotransferase n=1 Tax=Oribacterium sp. WCC10 TaxID=1855343 RepID=UPI0008E40055|nr:LL-diaminopimelate aminotransferase [Oribacterium sp. WCC10]SFG05691.1 LL-diaminopimelate aminotransferase apoenzyme [Oribacterium sp. WCC10]